MIALMYKKKDKSTKIISDSIISSVSICEKIKNNK
jgi:hypothetical protein